MKKLAINSFLAITAMAWTGAALGAEGRVEQGIGTVMAQSREEAGTERRGFDTRSRAVLAGWLQEQRSRLAAPPVAPVIQVGDRLPFELIRQGHTVPAHLRARLGTDRLGLVDVLMGQTLVRVERDTRRVVDVMV